MVDFRAPAGFTLDDFRRLVDRAHRRGWPGHLAALLPGAGTTDETDRDSQKRLARIKGIIDAMTPEERRDPRHLLDESRLRRIAAGAGVTAQEVSDLARQFLGMAAIMDQLAKSRPPDDDPR